MAAIYTRCGDGQVLDSAWYQALDRLDGPRYWWLSWPLCGCFA